MNVAIAASALGQLGAGIQHRSRRRATVSGNVITSSDTSSRRSGERRPRPIGRAASASVAMRKTWRRSGHAARLKQSETNMSSGGVYRYAEWAEFRLLGRRSFTMPSRYWSAAITVALGAALLSVIAWGLLSMTRSNDAFCRSDSITLPHARPPSRGRSSLRHGAG